MDMGSVMEAPWREVTHRMLLNTMMFHAKTLHIIPGVVVSMH